MEQQLNNILQYRHIKEPTTEILKYIDSRRNGTSRSLKTRWRKFNKQCMGGIEPNTIYTFAGISGKHATFPVFVRITYKRLCYENKKLLLEKIRYLCNYE